MNRKAEAVCAKGKEVRWAGSRAFSTGPAGETENVRYPEATVQSAEEGSPFAFPIVSGRGLLVVLTTGLFVVLLAPLLQAESTQPRTAVLGRWQLDKVRSPDERADSMIWALESQGKQLVWLTEVTNGDKTESNKHVYRWGESRGSFDERREWFFKVEYDDLRLHIQRRFHDSSELIQRWMDFYFEVKDHGHTLHVRQIWNKGVAVHERELYFRPVTAKKK